MSTIQEMSQETFLKLIEIQHNNKLRLGSSMDRNNIAQVAAKHGVPYCNDCMAMQDTRTAKTCWQCRSPVLKGTR